MLISPSNLVLLAPAIHPQLPSNLNVHLPPRCICLQNCTESGQLWWHTNQKYLEKVRKKQCLNDAFAAHHLRGASPESLAANQSWIQAIKFSYKCKLFWSLGTFGFVHSVNREGLILTKCKYFSLNKSGGVLVQMFSSAWCPLILLNEDTAGNNCRMKAIDRIFHKPTCSV